MFKLFANSALLPVAVIVAALVCSADDAPGSDSFDRYRCILDRMPFGREPPNFNPEDPAAASRPAQNAATKTEAQKNAEREEQKLQNSVRIVALNIRPDGQSMVGFIDSSSQQHANYYMREGESGGGWTVIKIDPAARTAVLKKGEISIELGLGKDSRDSKTAKTETAAAAAPASPVAASTGKPQLRSLQQLRMKRMADEEKRRAEIEQDRIARENFRKSQEIQQKQIAEQAEALAALQELGEQLRLSREEAQQHQEAAGQNHGQNPDAPNGQ